MSVFQLKMDRNNFLFLVPPINHLNILKKLRMKFIGFNITLSMVHQIKKYASIFNDELFNHVCHDIFVDSSSQDFDFSTFDHSKPQVCNDILFESMEHMQVIKELRPNTMFMSSFHSLEASSNFDQNRPTYFKDPHHSIAQI